MRALAQYLQSKAPPGRLPGRQHLDPTEISKFLAGIVLYDVERKDGIIRLRVRVWGTRVTDLMGRDCTGCYVDEMQPSALMQPVAAALRSVVETARLHYWERPVQFSGRGFLSYRRLALPMARDGETVDMVLGYFKAVSEVPARPLAAAPEGPTMPRGAPLRGIDGTAEGNI
ncbi:MAG TPA: PAS domain-containing protein [Stellaceae bacterium]|nr:PAS domain-containing protein [Stellaceae bacterium]